MDAFLAIVAIVALLPLFCLIIVLIKIDSSGSVFFRQPRVGKNNSLFNLIKFRSMRPEADGLSMQFEPGDDRRVTRVGRFLRKTKLDELPELFNVLLGDMSVVGPRPEVEKYVKLFKDDYSVVLKVRPGLSDLASIRYRDEERILANTTDPQKFYIKEILPDKLHLAKEYVQSINFKSDLNIILKTIKSIFMNNSE
jgi:lipopolysaccharide/colanic/teichoic acid biosynthesis glycosyltransferase